MARVIETVADVGVVHVCQQTASGLIVGDVDGQSSQPIGVLAVASSRCETWRCQRIMIAATGQACRQFANDWPQGDKG
jgi:hypothetical protein